MSTLHRFWAVGASAPRSLIVVMTLGVAVLATPGASADSVVVSGPSSAPFSTQVTFLVSGEASSQGVPPSPIVGARYRVHLWLRWDASDPGCAPDWEQRGRGGPFHGSSEPLLYTRGGPFEKRVRFGAGTPGTYYLCAYLLNATGPIQTLASGSAKVIVGRAGGPAREQQLRRAVKRCRQRFTGKRREACIRRAQKRYA